MMKSTTIHSAKPNLTTNDSSVLQALFDAESSPSNAVTIKHDLPPFPNDLNISQDLNSTLQACELEIIRTLNPTTPTTTTPPTPSTIQTAIKDLTALIKDHPTYPPAYVNRAQALRMLIDPAETSDSDATLFSHQHEETFTALFSDLGEAITLSTPRSPADPVSPAQARVLADAHTHRGYLLLRLAKVKRVGGDGEGPERLRGVDAERLEEMASRDFFFGGRYGNKVARELAVQTNPYAKMCGAIVKEALRKEVEG
ncbi:hypothetical protein BDV29DRAFT_179710 [Aspergillus leporis]|jgi:hypothetical protein|uniref:Tetratricopeptide repeat protein 36 n=1 Tax=Aspergillus leporis TaxID=41062 RepID=A0A5N5WRP5_9EURO|nr:hypothetical protein BDV29DRAFT_179710 [Aspergillus leporis]